MKTDPPPPVENARTLKAQREERRGDRGREEPEVQVRSLASYDALIA